jgi:hypothetical protein
MESSVDAGLEEGEDSTTLAMTTSANSIRLG